MTQKAYSYRASFADKLERSAESERASSGATALFRIYTERKDNLAALTAQRVQGATLKSTTGVWNGNPSPAMVIEVIGSYADRRAVLSLADDIARVNAQDAVLVTIQHAGQYTAVHINGGN